MPRRPSLVDTAEFACLSLFIVLAAAFCHTSSFASEYEVEGTVNQKIATTSGGTRRATASFKIFVRDCCWLIETMETNEIGGISHREVGSTNGIEIFECEQLIGRIEPSGRFISSIRPVSLTNASTAAYPTPTFAVIVSNNVPVGETDTAVVGHLWLMFASQCYWPSARPGQLIPVYDWQASAAARGQHIRVAGGWNLLGSGGSLPRQVWYLGVWGETNAIYTVTKSDFVGGVPIPTGFTFERSQIGPLKDDSLIHEMVVVKRVEVIVTALREKCSRSDLIPPPPTSAIVIDRRFDSGIPNRPPSYKNPKAGSWPEREQSKVLAAAQRKAELAALNHLKMHPVRRSKILLVLMCIALTAPVVFFGLYKLRKR